MRLSSSGGAVLAAAIVLYACGAVLGYPELVVVAAGGFLAVGGGALFVLYRPRMQLERHVEPAEVVVGQPALGLLEVRNLSRAPSAGFVAVDRLGPDRIDVAVPGLAPQGRSFLDYPIPTKRRGRFVHGPVSVVRSDLLGLVQHDRVHGSTGTLWVHPRSHPLLSLPAGVVLEMEGPISDDAPLGTLAFSSLREYVAGDDPRHIHWRSTARTGNLVVKEHVDSSQPRTTVALDTKRETWSNEAFEEAVEVAASLAASCQRRGDPLALVLGTDGVRPEPGLRLLDRLAEVEPAEDRDGWRLPWLLERSPPGGALVVITGSLDPKAFARLTIQRRRFAPVLIVSVQDQGPLRSARRSGVFVIETTTSLDFAAGWNHLVGR